MTESVDDAEHEVGVAGAVTEEAGDEHDDAAGAGDEVKRRRRRSPRRRAKQPAPPEDAGQEPAEIEEVEVSAFVDSDGAMAEVMDGLAVTVDELLTAGTELSPATDDEEEPPLWAANGGDGTFEPSAVPFAAVSDDLPLPAAEAAPVSDPEAERALREQEERLAEEARRTEVIRVGEGGDLRDEMPRRGWWQRLLT